MEFSFNSGSTENLKFKIKNSFERVLTRIWTWEFALKSRTAEYFNVEI